MSPPSVAPAHEPSPRSEIAADVTFENTCSVPIELFWVDFDGALQWYGYVGRGSVVTQSSFEGHRWIARPRGETRELLTSIAGEGSTHVEACPAGDPLRDPSPPPVVPPGGSPRRCTTEGGASMTLAWTNTCATPIEMQWVDFTCERRPYTTLAPGQTRTQQTFVGHVWRAEDPMGRVLFERPADAAEAHWILRCDGASGFGAAP
ncbi:MAG: hypothetical protein J0L92_12225 [Deltaproteobacteria bacterium]|nr:hypothetical protein [Deltaproteobacteria bacterium]